MVRSLFAIAAAVALFAVFALEAAAVNLTCQLPSEAVERSLELCELLRERLLVRPADWTNDVCATQVLRIGLIEAERVASTQAARATVSGQVEAAVAAMKTAFPVDVTRAYCGDSIVDAIGVYVETCDPPDGGVSCDDACQTIP